MGLAELAQGMTFGALLDAVRAAGSSVEPLDHWQQGEFHHDIILKIEGAALGLSGPYLLVATNCNGGVKELMVFPEAPTRSALWHARCPQSNEFSGQLPLVQGQLRTGHWFDPCELLKEDARSEIREAFRTRQPGGGWQLRAKPDRQGA